MFYTRKIASLIPRRAAAAMLRSRRIAAADEGTSGFHQAPPPSYLVLMEEGLPSYEEAVMVMQEMKQGMVSEVAVDEEEHCNLPSSVEAHRVEGTEVAASKDEALEEFKLDEVGTEMTSFGEVLEENLDEVKKVSVGTEMVVLELACGEALDEGLQKGEGALDEVKVAEAEGKNL